MNHIASPDTSDSGIERLIQTKAKISAARKRTKEMKKQAQSPLMGYKLRSKLATKAAK